MDNILTTAGLLEIGNRLIEKNLINSKEYIELLNRTMSPKKAANLFIKLYEMENIYNDKETDKTST